MNLDELREHEPAIRTALENDQERPDPFLLRGDGHGIFAPEAYTDRGIPAPVVEAVTMEHHSDPSMGPRGVVGVYHPRFLWLVGRILGAPMTSEYMGRGKRARDYVQQIVEALDPNPQGGRP